MQLVFEHSQQLGPGTQPAVFHSPDNVVQVAYVDGGQIKTMQADTPLGTWAVRVFTAGAQAAPDTAVQHLKLAYLPRINIFGTWRSGQRQRLGVYMLKQDVSKYVDDMTISMQEGTPVATMAATLENPRGIISAEEDELQSEAFPGTRAAVYLRMGNSPRVLMGTFYLDSINAKTGDPMVKITARNASGKLLKDQTFNEDGLLPVGRIDDNIKAILALAGVRSYQVAENANTAGMHFPPDMSLFDGLMEFLTVAEGWVVKENEQGHFAVGPPTFTAMHQPGTYIFNRGPELISREVQRSDMAVYARVCAHTRDWAVAVYRDIDFRQGWNLPQRKTFFVELPDGTTLADATAYANLLQGRMAQVGVVETFVGPPRPQLLPDDAAQINQDAGPQLLGTATYVTQYLGRKGFLTQFTVDSGGQLRKANLKDLIQKAAAPKGQAERLY